jgi:hypothetical protein
VALADARVTLDECWDDFAVAAVIPVQAGYAVAVDTSALWVDAGPNLSPGGEFNVNGARRVLALRLDQVASVVMGLRVQCPEYRGGPIKTWRVDGTERTEVDHVRTMVVEA